MMIVLVTGLFMSLNVDTASADSIFSYPLQGYAVTGGFKPNRNVEYKPGQWSRSAHLATDCKSTSGKWSVTPIYEGTVIAVNNALNSGRGRYIVIRHSINGITVYSLYQHLQSINVSKDTFVSKSTVIGVAGGSGTSENQFERHLHYQIFTGNYQLGTPVLTQYTLNKEYTVPVTYNGTTFYPPDLVVSGKIIIPGTVAQLEYPTISNGTAPTELANSVSSFGLRGTITSKYPITEIHGTIYNCTTGTITSDVTVAPNNTSYTLGGSGEKINDGLKFGDARLKDSWCRYVLKVIYNKEGTSCVKYMYDRYFKVGNPVSMTLMQPGFFEFICDDETRTGPAEVNDIVQKCTEGTIVYATEYELNSVNNMWLKLADGSYVWSGDVRRLEQQGDAVLVEEIHVSTAEGQEDQNEEYYGYNDDAKTVVLQAYAMPFDALNTDVVWTISNPNILRLDRSEKVDDGFTVGYFSIIGVGQTDVTVSAKDGSGVSRSIQVGYYISSLSLPNTNVNLSIGDKWNIRPDIQPSIAKNSDLDWSSSDPSIATVDENGVVTAVASGSATITASTKLPQYGSPTSPISCTVNVAPEPILAFNGISYPDPYKIDATNGYVWRDGSGTITARDGLASVVFNIYNKSGTRVAHYENSQNVTSLTMHSVSSQIKMSALTTAGTSRFEIIATDVNGHVLEASVLFTASSSGTTSSKTLNRTYMEPTLVTSTNYGQSRYELYRASYTWLQAGSFAYSRGGNLAAITSSEENAAVANMISSNGIEYAFIGGYRADTNYAWLTSEEMAYTNWANQQPDHAASAEAYMIITNTGKWNDVMSNVWSANYFVVELPFEATGSCGENVSWMYADHVLTIYGTGDMADYSDERAPWWDYHEDIYTLKIENGVTGIGANAFYDFINLRGPVTIPDSVTCIGNNAICVVDLYIPDSVTSIGESLLGCHYNVSSNNQYYSSEEGTLYNKDKTELIKCSHWAQNIDIPSSVKSIHIGAFAGCWTLTEIALPDTVTVIGDYTFEDCYRLTNIYIPSSVTSIGNGAFKYCRALTDVEIPYSVASIGEYAFWDTGLTGIAIPKNTTNIGWNAFYNFNSSILIFCYNESAAHVYAMNNNLDYVLFDPPFTPDFVLPAGITIIEEDAFYGIAAHQVKLSEGVLTICSGAFVNCPNLEAVFIPESCTSIAKDAFDQGNGVCIYCYSGSYAEFYANKYGFDFILVDAE